jgi:hypothetical protein
MPRGNIIICPAWVHLPTQPDISPDDGWEIPMKDLICVALAALSLIAAVLPAAYAASTIAREALATRKRQTGPLRQTDFWHPPWTNRMEAGAWPAFLPLGGREDAAKD